MLTLDELIDQLQKVRDDVAGSGRQLVALEVPLSDLLYIQEVIADGFGRVNIVAQEVDRT
jgi:hypothetical protein